MVHGNKYGRVTDVVDDTIVYVIDACRCATCSAKRVKRKRAARVRSLTDTDIASHARDGDQHTLFT